MRLTIQVTEGPLAGFKTDLSEGQVAIVGRADRSDFAIPHDRYLSGRHAMVECTREGCRLLDLKSTNGTWLNGSRVVDAGLLDGDMVMAGRTILRISIQTERDHDASEPKPAIMRTVHAATPAAAPADRDDVPSSIRDRIKKEDLEHGGDDESTDHLPLDAAFPIDPPTQFLPGRPSDSVSNR